MCLIGQIQYIYAEFIYGMLPKQHRKVLESANLREAIKPGITEQRNNGISENYILNILLLYIQSIAFIQYSPRNNSTENH